MRVHHNDWLIDVDVTSFYAGRPAVIHLAPEDCHPAEDMEIEFQVTCIEPDGEADYDMLPDGDTLYELVATKYLEEMRDI